MQVNHSPAPFDPPLADDRPALSVRLTVGGSSVRTWVYPALGRTRGVMLMVHGFRGDHHGLRRLINALPGFLVIAPDLPGFGASTPFTQPGFDHTGTGYESVVLAIMDSLALPPETILLGHSFGSIVAAGFSARNPDSHSALILVNPICRPALQTSRSQAAFTALAAGYYELAARVPRRTGEALLRARAVVDITTAAMLTSDDPATRTYVRDQHRAYFAAFSDPVTLLSAYHSSISDSVRDVATELRVPTLLVAGEDDPLGSVQGQVALARLIPDARLEVIPSVGHLIHYETPRTAGRAIEDFLGRPS